jgi:uncharacterized protein (TIGR03382 family)
MSEDVPVPIAFALLLVAAILILVRRRRSRPDELGNEHVRAHDEEPFP